MDYVVCQNCNCSIHPADAVKVSGEGFICSFCLMWAIYEDKEDAKSYD